MRNVNVALWGFGAMASGIAKVLLEKEGVTVIGACDIDPRKIGKSIYELLGVEQGDRPDAFITDDISTLIDKEKCDICVIATDSFTKKVESNFKANVCYKDFGKEDVKSIINQWCEEKTHGMIKNFLKDPVTPDQ